MPLALQIDRRKQLLKILFLWRFSLAAGEMSWRLCAGTRTMLGANQSVCGNAVGLHSISRVCPRQWERERWILWTPRQFQSTVVGSPYGSSLPQAKRWSWDHVRPCSLLTQSFLELETTFELGKDFSMLDKAGSIEKGQQAGRTSELSGMDVSPTPWWERRWLTSVLRACLLDSLKSETPGLTKQHALRINFKLAKTQLLIGASFLGWVGGVLVLSGSDRASLWLHWLLSALRVQPWN